LTTERQAVLVGVIGAIALAANLLAPLSGFDGGLAGSAGTFILHGAIPYRDFWWLYGPAAPVAAAAFTAILGPSVLLLRLLGLVIVGVQVGLGYWILRPRIPHAAAALISIGAAAASTFLVGLEIAAWSLAMVLALAGLALRLGDSRRPLIAGVLVGLAFAARLDVGAYALIAGMFASNRRAFVVGFALIALPLTLAALLTTPMSALFEQLVWFPLVGTRRFRALPLPEIISPAALEAFIAVIVVPKVAIVLAGLRLAFGRDRSSDLLVMTIFAIGCQLQTFGRADLYHQAQAAFPAYLVLGMVGARVLQRARTPVQLRNDYARLFGFAAVSGACALSLVVGALSLPASERDSMPPGERELVAGIRTFIANTTRDEGVFVGLTENRITPANDMLAYYLANRRSIVRVAMFNPGVTNTDAVQEEMTTELAAHGASVVLLDELWAHLSEPSNESAILGSTVLDRYIDGEFIEACRFGSVQVLATRERAPSIRCVEPRPDERLIDILGGLGSG
jgi:hypothetical protein